MSPGTAHNRKERTGIIKARLLIHTWRLLKRHRLTIALPMQLQRHLFDHELLNLNVAMGFWEGVSTYGQPGVANRAA